jgi:hypothetical protein
MLHGRCNCLYVVLVQVTSAQNPWGGLRDGLYDLLNRCLTLCYRKVGMRGYTSFGNPPASTYIRLDFILIL